MSRRRIPTWSRGAWWCIQCDEAIFEGPALAARERAFAALRAEVEGV